MPALRALVPRSVIKGKTQIHQDQIRTIKNKKIVFSQLHEQKVSI